MSDLFSCENQVALDSIHKNKYKISWVAHTHYSNLQIFLTLQCCSCYVCWDWHFTSQKRIQFLHISQIWIQFCPCWLRERGVIKHCVYIYIYKMIMNKSKLYKIIINNNHYYYYHIIHDNNPNGLLVQKYWEPNMFNNHPRLLVRSNIKLNWMGKK